MRSTSFTLALALVAATTLGLTTGTAAQAAAPTAPTVTVESASLTTGGGSATCSNHLARAVGGGYDLTSSDQVSVTYPSGAASWTVDAPTEFELTGTAYAVCALGDLTVTTHSAPLTADTATTVTCPNALAKALGGGFRADDSQSAAHVSANHPAGTRPWTVKASAPDTAYVVCGVAELSVTIESVPLTGGEATVTCADARSNVLGGGFSVDGAAVPTSYPSGTRSWTVNAASTTTTGTAYAVCAAGL